MNSFSLEQVINPHPLIVNPSTPLIETIGLMNRNSVASCHLDDEDSELKSLITAQTSCALVMAEAQLLGIFTERDLVQLTAEGRTLAEMTVGEAMTQPLTTFPETELQDLFAIVSLTRQHRFRHFPVVNQHNQLLGIITPEAVQRLLEPMDWLRFQRVGEVMSNTLSHALPTVSVLRVTQLMVQHQVGCVVIAEHFQSHENSELETSVENSYLRPVGIITERDIIQFQTLELNLGNIQARTLMSTPLFLVSPFDSLWEVHQQMQQRRVRRLIVAGEQGELKGIINQNSLLQALDPKEMYGVIEVLQRQVKKRTLELSELYQKNAEQAALIDIATDAIFVRDLENRILFWSQGAERLYGWTAAETLGQKAQELFCQESPSQLEANLKTTVEKGSWQGELQQVKKDGTEIVVASRWTLVHHESGQPKSILVVNTDITQKKQLEQQLYRAQRLESLGTLASGIAHDLNNIFTPILGIAQLLLLKLPELDERTQELLETLEDSAKRGAKMVKQILTFARGAKGKRISLQVEHILHEVAKIARQTFPKSIEIRTDIPARTLWTVRAEPTKLDRIFMNLAVNARDAMPHGGILNFSAENCFLDEIYTRMYLDAREGNYVAVTVSDTGMGIPPEQKERIFEPFFTTKEVGKGTGLGLSTVLGIVKSHGGFLEVLSEVGKGTQFKVYLPATETTAAQPSEEEQMFRGKGELILVVDDEAVVRQITKATLSEYNYRTLVAGDGIEALALYAEHRQEISVVLMDLMMPNMDGLTAICTLQKINPQVKIVATSGIPANTQEVLSAGAIAFLSKPYTAKELLYALSALL